MIFPTGGHAAAKVAFLFVYLQDAAHFLIQSPILPRQTQCHIFMDGVPTQVDVLEVSV